MSQNELNLILSQEHLDTIKLYDKLLEENLKAIR